MGQGLLGSKKSTEQVTGGLETNLLWILPQSPYLFQEVNDRDKATIYCSRHEGSTLDF